MMVLFQFYHNVTYTISEKIIFFCRVGSKRNKSAHIFYIQQFTYSDLTIIVNKVLNSRIKE